MAAAGGAPPSVGAGHHGRLLGLDDQPVHQAGRGEEGHRHGHDTLREGVPFAIVAGRGRADMVFPSSVQLVPANPQTREQAKAAVNRLNGSGGTAMGTWLTLANHLFARSNAEVKHAIMLTDGENQHETAEQLAMVLQACQGRFVCDTRGVGEGWKGTELLKTPRPCWAAPTLSRSPTSSSPTSRR